MLFKWYNLHMLRRKKYQHRRAKKETRFPSALIPRGWISTAEEATGRSSVRYLRPVRMSAPAPLPLPPLLRRDGAGSAGSSAPVHSAGKQLSQPLRKPRSPHCVLKTPARAKGVALLFTSFVIMLFPKKRLRHLICRWNNFPMMPLCDYCHFFPHNNVKYNIKLWIFYSEWNQQSQKTDSAGSAVTAPFCKTAPG